LTSFHALILLNVDCGQYNLEQQINEEICKVLKIGMRTIDRVKKRFVEEGLDAALKMATMSREYFKLVDGDMEAHQHIIQLLFEVISCLVRAIVISKDKFLLKFFSRNDHTAKTFRPDCFVKLLQVYGFAFQMGATHLMPVY
jgi:hypothetical protein